MVLKQYERPGSRTMQFEYGDRIQRTKVKVHKGIYIQDEATLN